MQTNQIYLGDCAEVMQTFPDNCIDLTVTSPPYDGLRTYQGYKFNFEGIAQELYRITKAGGVVVWVVADATINGSETGTSFRQALYFKDIGFNLHDTMIYQTNKPPINSPRYQPEFEYMFVFSKGVPKTVNLIKIPSEHPGTKNGGGMRNKKGEITCRTSVNRTGEFKTRGNIWYLPRSSKSGDIFSREHPATFPDQLANDHILSWSNPGDIVLDPMCGSGTTCKMAQVNDRRYIGIDCAAEYVAFTRQRLEGWLFDEPEYMSYGA